MHAEIVLGTVTNVREAVGWLGYTYLARRLERNPQAYGVTYDQLVVDPGLDGEAGRERVWACVLAHVRQPVQAASAAHALLQMHHADTPLLVVPPRFTSTSFKAYGVCVLPTL